MLSKPTLLIIFVPFILQPYLGEMKSGVNALTILLGFFSGPIIFGVKGLLLGPILFVITETILEEHGLIECLTPEKHTWKKYILTKKGEQIFEMLRKSHLIIN